MEQSRRSWIITAAGTGVLGAGGWTMYRSRSSRGPSVVTETLAGEKRIITSNGMPGHAVGDYPNSHDPVPIRKQTHKFEMRANPTAAEKPAALGFWIFGVAVNGVPFDPSGPFWNADGNSGWQFDVLCPTNALALGIDVNRAHTQGRGTYHYHGLPTGLLWNLRNNTPERSMHLIGRAADGFPIYGPDAPGVASDLKSPLRRLRSSWRLRSGTRSNGPKGRFDGTFVEDYEYVPGWGDLDECNGRLGPTPEYPDGIYHYFVTDEFPYIPRFYRGTPDQTFRHGPPPGVSPPLPSELRRYRPIG